MARADPALGTDGFGEQAMKDKVKVATINPTLNGFFMMVPPRVSFIWL